MFVSHLKSLFSYKFLVLFVLLFLELGISCEGFIAGTLVKTQNGYIPIEQLKKNDCITSYNFKEKDITCGKILKITKKHYDKCIKLKINDQEIIAAPDHKFFCPLKKGCWIKAQDIEKNDFVLKEIKELVRIDDVVKIDQENDFYCLSIDSNHNFFVSQQNILVHNIPIFAYVVGEGFIWAGGGELLSYALGLVIACIAKQKGADTSNYNPFNINRPNPNKWKHHVVKPPKHNFNGMDPDTVWELTELAIVAAIKNKELKNGCEYVVNYATQYGNLVVKGKVVDKIVEVGTAFFKKVY
ncbi:MAG: Hint domain-containing protein [Candidatus Babeliales bacterium]|nr:Hint domain-containing protein [Candidatus Babeliales bacterium]